MDIENLSIAEAKKMGLGSFGHLGKTFASFMDKILIENYEDFIRQLYKDLDEVIQTLQLNRELRQKDSEDRITIDIVNILSAKGYTSSHDKKSGGHVDITVELRDFIWFGEAKKHEAYGNLLEGFKQLCTRYTTGEVNQNNGGL